MTVKNDLVGYMPSPDCVSLAGLVHRPICQAGLWLTTRVYNSGDSVGLDLLRLQNRSMAAELAHGNTKHFSDHCLAVKSVFKILRSFSSRNQA